MLNTGDTKLIIAEARKHGLDRYQLAYVLATARHETANTMKPVMETLADSVTEAQRRLERAWTGGRLPWVKTPYWRSDSDGKSWLGRGYVQLTWKDNYKKAGDKLGLDLVSNPDAVMKPKVAAQILVRGMVEGWFTGQKLADYKRDHGLDYVNARRIVNGTDRAEHIAMLAREYEKELKLHGLPKTPTAPVASFDLAKLFSWLAGAIRAMFARK